MQQTKKWQGILFFWLGSLLLFGTFLVLIQDILLPFIVAMITAYFLDPVADKLEESGLSRSWATATIVGLFFFIMVVAAMLLVPILYEQFLALAKKIPTYSHLLQEKLLPIARQYLGHIDQESLDKAKAALGNASGTMFGIATKFIGSLLQSTMALVNLLLLIFVTPIVTFYFLRDWDRMLAKIDGWLPRSYASTIKEQALLIDQALSGYIRGQTNVCLLLGVFYAIGLSLIGLDFGLFIGLGTGLLSFIPYVGILFGLVIGLLVAFFQFGDALHIGLVLGFFILGQVIEGNFVTPKLVGDKVGLHPVWIIFGMLAGAALFNFIGILLAVPLTAIIAVLVRFGLDKYLDSRFYHIDDTSKSRKDV